MAKQIKETPVLTGENLKHFNSMLESNKDKRASRQEYLRVKTTYQTIMANSKLA